MRKATWAGHELSHGIHSATVRWQVIIGATQFTRSIQIPCSLVSQVQFLSIPVLSWPILLCKFSGKLPPLLVCRSATQLLLPLSKLKIGPSRSLCFLYTPTEEKEEQPYMVWSVSYPQHMRVSVQSSPSPTTLWSSHQQCPVSVILYLSWLEAKVVKKSWNNFSPGKDSNLWPLVGVSSTLPRTQSHTSEPVYINLSEHLKSAVFLSIW